MEGTPLLDVMRGLILEPEAQADFAADPSGYMQRFGYDDVPEEDLREAVGLVADTLPPDVAHAVNTAAASEPSDADAYGDGTVGLLGRISTAEVTESVVPELDDLPDAPPDGGGLDDAFGDDHDATTFGDVMRDFDEAEADAEAGTDAGSEDDLDDADPGDPGGLAADQAGEAADGAGGLADDAGQDVSFGDGGFDDDPDGGAFGAGEAEAFGQGSAADVDGGVQLDGAGDGAFDVPPDADDLDGGGFDTDPSFPAPEPADDTFDDGGYGDSFDDDLAAADDFGTADDAGGDHGAADGDVGSF